MRRTNRREDVMRRIAEVSVPVLLIAAALVVAGCTGDAAVLHNEEPWEIASADAQVLDEVTVVARRPAPDVAEVEVRAERPEMPVEEVVVLAPQPEGLPAPAEVSAVDGMPLPSGPNVY